MRVCHRSFTVLALAALATISTFSARAQSDRLPQTIIVETESYSAEEQQTIADYVGRSLGVLQRASDQAGQDEPSVTDAQVSEARARLLLPLRTPGASEFFRGRYSAVVSEGLLPLMESQRLGVRLNAMIVANRLTDDGALELIEAGLLDDNPSVRYWAAEAVRNLASATTPTGEPVLTIVQRLALLRQLKAMAQNESSSEVLQVVLLAMVSMDQPAAPVPAAVRESLDALNTRLKWHVDRPFEPFMAETSGLRAVYQKVLAGQGGADTANVRELARIAMRFMALASEHLASAKADARAQGLTLSRELRDDHAALIELTDAILRYAHGELGSSEPVPDSVRQPITFGDWARINLIATQGWAGVLKAEPFLFTDRELRIVDE